MHKQLNPSSEEQLFWGVLPVNPCIFTVRDGKNKIQDVHLDGTGIIQSKNKKQKTKQQTGDRLMN